MSRKSNDQGRAFEFITLITLGEEINKVREATIIKNSSYEATKRAWENIDTNLQADLKKAAVAAVGSIFDLEPMILEDGNDKLELLVQQDSQGEKGDVRDILIVRRNVKWEIGLSLKHNHFAVKHSRLSKRIDFGEKWFNIPCSKQYWDEVNPLFDYLQEEKIKGTKWRDLPDKENDVYVPLLNSFKDEVVRSNKLNSEVPKRMVEYLLGEYDFYKVVSVDAKKITQIFTFNLRGTLNKASKTTEPTTVIPVANLPTRIVEIDFKPGKKNTIEMFMDEGWQFSFRIHNASTKVEPSLKFDVQIVGMPTTIISINCMWM
ncbi:HaeIII family restriction endonuclease [uncultured Methanobrevibacter sp.]|uniref:HaeIII family restriction endonuclease n=1 Tax=uncultured Methanobrevibacter sp. TaxID=253161 RepID=UPI0025F72325|nr:HaeIII family restriction endonuclease [uncultured Methanobrevibacter sp.]